MSEKGFAVGGAIAAAIAASLCCVGPVLFAVLGLGAFGAASFFAAARPYLLAGAVLLLAVGFYWTYFRRGIACAPGEACATKPVSRIGRAGLWIATIAVLTFALAQTPGVRTADVSYKRGDARIEFDPKRTNLDQIKRAIDSTGYKAK